MTALARTDDELPALIRLIRESERSEAVGLDLRRKYARDGFFLRVWLPDLTGATNFVSMAERFGFRVTLMARQPCAGTAHDQVTTDGWQICVVVPAAAVEAAKPYGHLTGIEPVCELGPSPRELTR